ATQIEQLRSPRQKVSVLRQVAQGRIDGFLGLLPIAQTLVTLAHPDGARLLARRLFGQLGVTVSRLTIVAAQPGGPRLLQTLPRGQSRNADNQEKPGAEMLHDLPPWVKTIKN